MKTLKLPVGLLVITIASIFIFNSCTKDESLSQDINENLIGVSAKAKNADIIVSPSGDVSGSTDADAIENALTNLPTGGVLLIESGTYYVNRTIIAPEGFSGTITGEGATETELIIIGDNANPFNVGPAGPERINETVFQFFNPNSFVNMNDLAISLPNDVFTNTSTLPRGLLWSFIIVGILENETSTNFDGLKLTGFSRPEGQPPFPFPVEESVPTNGIFVAAPTTFPFEPNFGGQHTITNSEFSNIGFTATAYSRLKNADILLRDNSYTNFRKISFQFMDGCNIEVKGNSIQGKDLGLLQFWQPIPISGSSNSVMIKDNAITVRGFTAIEVSPSSSDANYHVTIKDNQLTNLGDSPTNLGQRFPSFAVVAIYPGNDNAIVKDNTILGNTDYGIWQESNLGSFKVNDFSNFNENLFDFILKGDNNELKDNGPVTVEDEGTGNTIKN